jgi:CDP-2,3-bis-(O-geranylgeranyl)-sn-glycerol synthase
MHLDRITELLLLLAVANGIPVLAKRLFGDFLAWPLDGGATLPDGRPVFGSSKTIRGIAASIVATAACAPVFGLSPSIGLIIAVTAMGGDLLSSFVKRRFGYASSSRASGLDQIPESLLPAIVCKDLLGLTVVDIVLVVTLFTVGEIVLSRLLFRLHIREQPY